jgi:hypothetical protein
MRSKALPICLLVAEIASRRYTIHYDQDFGNSRRKEPFLTS